MQLSLIMITIILYCITIIQFCSVYFFLTLYRDNNPNPVQSTLYTHTQYYNSSIKYICNYVTKQQATEQKQHWSILIGTAEIGKWWLSVVQYYNYIYTRGRWTYSLPYQCQVGRFSPLEYANNIPGVD